MMLRIGMVVGLVALLQAGSVGQVVGVYGSEMNAEEYGGIYQEPVFEWLNARGLEYEVVGDGLAADAEQLAAYDVIVASSTYLVPDSAADGLVVYVEGGGQLLWIDNPARCRHDGLLTALGLGDGAVYGSVENVTLTAQAPGDPLALAGQRITANSVVGNWAPTADPDALVVYTATGVMGGAERTLPAVIARETGEGRAVCVNWIVWAQSANAGMRILDVALDYLLAHSLEPGRGPLITCRPDAAAIRQPAPLSLSCHVYAPSEDAADVPDVRLSVVGPDNAVLEATLSDLAWIYRGPRIHAATGSLTVPTGGLDDGEYTVRWQAGGSEGQVQVALSGQAWERAVREEAERRELLEPRLVGTLGDYDAEPRTPEGRVDLPRLMEQIETAHMNMYDFLIWHAETDWEDFQEFLPLARDAGIKVWVTICPPSEQGGRYPHSEPYKLDFIKWADEIGKLAATHENLVAFVIDDFAGGNLRLFTPDCITRLVSTLRAHREDVAFLPTIYWPDIGNQEFIEAYGPVIDGIVFPYCEYVTGDQLEEQLAAAREWLGPSKVLMVNVYAAGSGGGEAPARTAAYVRKTLTVSREHSDGIRIYCLPKADLLDDERYAVTAELYGEWAEE